MQVCVPIPDDEPYTTKAFDKNPIDRQYEKQLEFAAWNEIQIENDKGCEE